MRRGLLGLGIAAFLLAGAGSVVHAAPIGLLGPNLSATGTGSFSGAGPCSLDGTLAIDASATDPGIIGTSGAPTCTTAGTVGGTETFVFTALNGFQIDDISASIVCGVTGNDAGQITFGSLVLNCPTETTLGAVGTVSQEVTFAPVLTATEPLTVSGTSVTGSSITVDSLAINVSLVAPSAVPEPADWALMLAGVGLVGAMLRSRGAAVAV